MKSLLSSLKEKALKATPGPWRHISGNREIESRNEAHWRVAVVHTDSATDRSEHFDRMRLDDLNTDNLVDPYLDAEFIAACDPQTILKLIECIDEIRATLCKITGKMDGKFLPSVPHDQEACAEMADLVLKKFGLD